MSEAISAWAAWCSVQSPDQRWTAGIDMAGEVAMGAPTRGTLKLSNGMQFDDFNPSIVWASDSSLLAAPLWHTHLQRLLIIDPPARRWCVLERNYRVLELAEFESGVIRGVDSPIWKPERLHVDLSQIDMQ